MAVKFLEITEDPYTNTSNLFVLMLTNTQFLIPNPSAPGTGSSSSGLLYDPNGKTVGYMWNAYCQDYEVTGSLSDEAYSHSWTHEQHTMLIPPGYKLTTFVAGIAIQGTLEELAPFIRGM